MYAKYVAQTKLRTNKTCFNLHKKLVHSATSLILWYQLKKTILYQVKVKSCFQERSFDQLASDYPLACSALTLLTWVTTASRTSPLKGLNTMALYLTGYTTKPRPGWMNPAPMLSIVVTAITNPYLTKEKNCRHTGCFGNHKFSLQ